MEKSRDALQLPLLWSVNVRLMVRSQNSIDVLSIAERHLKTSLPSPNKLTFVSLATRLSYHIR